MLAAAAPPAREPHIQPPRFVRAWGKIGSGDGEFSAAIGIAIDRHDRIFVTDLGNRRVQRFDADGKFQAAFAVAGHPGGIAIGRDGTVYLALFHESRIAAYTPEGKLLRQWGEKGEGDGQLRFPTGLAVGPDGSVYVSDHFNRRIQKFSPEGKLLAKWGGAGDGPGRFGGKDVEKLPPALGTGPGFLAFDGKGLLHVTDPRGGKVHRFKPDGTYVSSWGSNDDRPGGFGGNPKSPGPVAIAVDGRGRVWVGAMSNRVQLFTARGEYLTGFGGKGAEKGQFQTPHGLAIDSKGSLYVVDTRNSRIQKFAW